MTVLLALALQTLTVPTPLRDSNGDGIIEISTARPPFPRGARLRLCPDLPNYTYAVTCPVSQQPQAAPGTITPPRITTPQVAGSGTARAPRHTDLDMLRAMEAYPMLSAAGYDNVRIADVRLGSVRAGVYNAYNPDWPSGSTTSASGSIRGLVVERVEMTCAKYCVAVGRESRNIRISDFTFRGGAPRTDSSIPVGIRFTVDARDILIERGYVGGFRQTPRSYTNGDGISTERGNVNVTIRWVTSEDNADGGFDLKSSNTRLENLTARRNGHQNYRLWADGTASTLTSEDPGRAHIWARNTARWTIDRLIAIGGGPLVQSERGAIVEIRSCDLSRWTGTALTTGAGTVILGEGCRR